MTDRLTKAVEKVAEFDHRLGWHVSRGDADRLVRRQFAAMRRMVKEQRKKFGDPVNYAMGYRRACGDLLEQMDRWRRGR